MIERARGARFLLEASQTRLIMRAREQDLDRHVPPKARVPGPVHLAHSARAEKSDDFVRADASSGAEPVALRVRNDSVLRFRRGFEEASGLVVRGEKRLDFAPQLAIVAACSRQEVGPRRRRLLQRSGEKLLRSVPALGRLECHRRVIFRWSQALATQRCNSMVRACEASRAVKPFNSSKETTDESEIVEREPAGVSREFG